MKKENEMASISRICEASRNAIVHKNKAIRKYALHKSWAPSRVFKSLNSTISVGTIYFLHALNPGTYWFCLFVFFSFLGESLTLIHIIINEIHRISTTDIHDYNYIFIFS